MNRLQSIAVKLLGLSQLQERQEKPDKIIPFKPVSSFGMGEPAPMDQRAQMDAYRSWVYSSAKKISDNVAGILDSNLRLFRRIGPGKSDEVEAHAVLDLLDRVNENMTRYDLLELLSLHLELAGEHFWWKVRSNSGQIVEIWPWLNPVHMGVLPGKDRLVEGYIYQTPSGERIPFERQDILHFKYTNPVNPYRGMSPVKAAELAVASDQQASKWNWRFFRQGAKPYLAMSVPGTLTQDQYDRVIKQWESRHMGEDNAHKLAIVESGTPQERTEIKEIGVKQKDMDFIEQRRMSKEEIYEIFGIPAGLVSSKDVNRATAEAHRAVFIEDTIIPKLRKIVSYLNEFLLPDFKDDRLFFDFDDPSPRNLEEDLSYYESGLKNGWLSPNEVRNEENLPPYEGGSQFFIPQNVVSVGTEPKESKGLPRKFNTKKLGRTQQEVIAEMTKEELARYRKRKNGKEKEADKKGKVTRSLAENEKAEIWRKKVIRTDEDEKNFARLLRKEFSRQEEEVLKTVTKKSYSEKGFEFNVAKEATRMEDIFGPFVRIIIAKYGAEALETLIPDVTFSDSTARISRFLKEEGLKFAKEINKTTKVAIAENLRRGVEAGEGITKLKNRVRAVFSEASNVRAERIARTEVSRASNMGTIEGWQQSGLVKKKEWLTALDERVCPYCAPMHGKTITLGRRFFDQGSTFKGNAKRPIKFGYSDIQGPPLHVNCRCTLIPVID